MRLFICAMSCFFLVLTGASIIVYAQDRMPTRTWERSEEQPQQQREIRPLNLRAPAPRSSGANSNTGSTTSGNNGSGVGRSLSPEEFDVSQPINPADFNSPEALAAAQYRQRFRPNAFEGKSAGEIVLAKQQQQINAAQRREELTKMRNDYYASLGEGQPQTVYGQGNINNRGEPSNSRQPPASGVRVPTLQQDNNEPRRVFPIFLN